MECFKIENLSFSYSGSEEKVLNNVRLSVKKGEFLTVCGRSGCGKTTLLRHMKPALTPYGETEGEVYFCGERLKDLSREISEIKIGYVQQNPDNMIVTDKVWHELAFGLENMGMSPDEIKLRTAEISAFFGLQNIFHKKVSELSGGQKQLLNLASIMVMDPTVLILDEPTSQLDPIAAQEFLKALKKVNTEFGVTVIISEHRTEEVFALSDRVAVMGEGIIEMVMPPRELGTVLKGCNIEPMLPTAMRVFAAAETGGICPVTVAEGKEWLENTAAVRKIKAFEEKEKPQKGKAAITVNEVFFRYEKEIPDVLSGVSAKIFFGEVFGIVGGNGAGKSTLLSLVCGLKKPCRGRISVDESCKMAMLPQNPQSMFLKKTVELDLLEILEESNRTEAEKAEEVRNAARLCEIEHILQRHPYDISGGEQQRAALAKILLLKPNLILMDEPTKGMDAFFKQSFGAILKSLKAAGTTIVIVSHDIEFCAEYTDRCGMLFDGKLVSTGSSKKFFAGNRFYTTAANRMARNIIPNAVLAEDIIRALGGETPKSVEKPQKSEYIPKEEEQPRTAAQRKERVGVKYAFGLVFVALFLYIQSEFAHSFTDWRSAVVQLATVLFCALAIVCFVPRRFRDKKVGMVQLPKEKRRLTKRTALSALLTLIAVPLTMFIGIFYLGDRKYFIISILIIVEVTLPFFMLFEGRKPQTSELVTISVLCAIGVAGRIVFAALPQFKPMLTVVIVAGVCFGGETGFLVGAICGFVSNFYFGQGPWTPWQMFALGIVGFAAGILFQKGFLRKTRLSLCLFGGFAAVVIYGGIMNPSSIVMMQQQFTTELVLSYYITGLPFDLVHGAATVAFLWIGSMPIIEKLERIKTKYGIMR